jgi:hypothetical protein
MFILDLDRVRQWCDAAVDERRVSPLWGDRLRWRVCPECLWLTISMDPTLDCGRAPGDDIGYGGRLGSTPRACSVDRLTVVPDHYADAMFSALRLGGINALVGMLADLPPQDLGLLSSVEKWRATRKRKHRP